MLSFCWILQITILIRIIHTFRNMNEESKISANEASKYRNQTLGEEIANSISHGVALLVRLR